MLYDPKWEVETKPKPSLAGMAAWLETKDPTQKYPWSDCDGNCLIGQYLSSLGLPWKATHDRIDGRPLYDILTAMDAPQPLRCIALKTPHTFGAALERVRAVLAHAEEACEK